MKEYMDKRIKRNMDVAVITVLLLVFIAALVFIAVFSKATNHQWSY